MSELTHSEKEMIGFVAGGLTTRKIIRETRYTETTIESMRTRIYRKLGAKNAPHAVALAIKQNLI